AGAVLTEHDLLMAAVSAEDVITALVEQYVALGGVGHCGDSRIGPRVVARASMATLVARGVSSFDGVCGLIHPDGPPMRGFRCGACGGAPPPRLPGGVGAAAALQRAAPALLARLRGGWRRTRPSAWAAGRASPRADRSPGDPAGRRAGT